MIVLSGIVVAVKINEVELNPPGEDRNREWIELYSEESVDLDGWKIMNAKDKNLSLNFSFSGYKTIYAPYQFLTNENQKLRLVDPSGNIVDETKEISDKYDDGRTWQICNKWEFEEQTMGENNFCEDEQEVIVENEAVVKKEENEEDKTPEENAEGSETKIDTTGNTISEESIVSVDSLIKLEPKDIKTWKSKIRYIKEYALVGFALFCFLVLIIAWRYENGRKNKFNSDF